MIETSTHKKRTYFGIFKIPQTTRPIIIYISKFEFFFINVIIFLVLLTTSFEINMDKRFKNILSDKQQIAQHGVFLLSCSDRSANCLHLSSSRHLF